MIVLVIAVGVGAGVGRWWAMALPLVLGTAVAALLAASGHSLADTPVASVVLVATAAIGVGVFLRRRSPRTPSLP